MATEKSKMSGRRRQKNTPKHHIHIRKSTLLVAALAILSFGFFAYHKSATVIPIPEKVPAGSPSPAKTAPPIAPVLPIILPHISPRITPGVARIVGHSPKDFAYAHGTVAADGKIFIGMASKAGNPFPTNEILIFADPSDLSHPTLLSLPAQGDIETMVYDGKNDRIYFALSGSASLRIFSLDPRTYSLALIASTTALDLGSKPAIATDGTYIYGITDTDPSSVFRVGIHGDGLVISSMGHIPHGHSAAVSIYGSTTGLYFGGGMTDGFEKTDAATLAPIASMRIDPCGMSDDMPVMPVPSLQAGVSSGSYVYIGCERVPYGVRVRTGDMTYERFSLPGYSLGLFAYGDDLYNAANDGTIDVFPGGDLTDLHRYKIADDAGLLDAKGQDAEPNEIFYVPESNRLFFTAWWGIEGLYEVATNTPPML